MVLQATRAPGWAQIITGHGVSLLYIVLAITLVYICRLSCYWKRKGVPSYGNCITGVFTKVFTAEMNVGNCLKSIYFQTKHLKYYGTFIFGQPVLILQDKEIIKHVFVKEHANFSSHAVYYNKNKQPMSGHLFNLAGSDWKFIRSKLAPSFTTAKVKIMLTAAQDILSRLHKQVDQDRGRMNDIVNISNLMSRLTCDIILAAAFGIEADSMKKSDSVFRKLGKNFFVPKYIPCLKYLFRSNFKLCKIFSVQEMSPRANDFFIEAFTKMVQYRKENNIRKNDFLDLLIGLNNDKTKTGEECLDRKLTMEDIAAQSFIFFAAGFETSATTITFILFELAKHQNVQRKVQAECDRVMEACGNKVTYEALQSMKYLDKVLKETQRLYPALSYLARSVTTPCKLPTTNLLLEKNTIVWVPLFALQTDEDNFENPHKFEPERFSEENKKNFSQYVYMPFGSGPRHCIGMSFALVQVKSSVLEMMRSYNVELIDDKRDVQIHPSCFVSSPMTDIRLKVTPRVT